jgi:ABC-type dipeptide/oligopeptide/nickel transport system permease component
VASRLGRALLVTVGVVTVTFLLVRLTPGDAATMLCDNCTAQDVERLRDELGLRGSVPEQYATYISGFLTGDFGHSLRSRQPVADIIAARLPVTLGLVLLTSLFTVSVAVPIGLLAALRRHQWFGQAFRIGASLLVALPVYFTGVVGILIFAIALNVTRSGGLEPGFVGALGSMWLPALVLTIAIAPVAARVLQASITETLDQEFVEAAYVRDVGRFAYYWRYLLRPSLAPTIALIGYIVGTLIGSAVLIELVFNLPGMGFTLIDAVAFRDYPVVQGIVFTAGIAVVIVTASADVLAALIDPRTAAAR